MRLTLVVVCAAGLAASGARTRAQVPAEVRLEPGYATGHVVCGDTQRPARLAKVRFVPVPSEVKAVTEQDAPKSKMAGLETQQFLGSEINPVETDMEGNFVTRNLKPGRYVVRVDLGGYLVPLLSVQASDFEHPDEAARERMARELQIVDIRPRAETRVDVTLQRGATISGTVQFDDGSPAIEIPVDLMVRNAKGQWQANSVLGYRFGATDGEGRYWVDGVPAGEYLVQANLSLSEYSNSVLPMNGNQVHVQMTKIIFSLPVYSGSVLREKEAKPIKAEGGETLDGNDIVIPVAKLHRVSGTVVGGGHPLNHARVVLRYADDNTELTGIEVDREDRQFHFPYVPEGSYTLAVEEPRDVTEVEVPNAPGVTPKTRIEEKTVRSYGPAEQPLLVQNDVEGVLVAVPDAKEKSAAGTSQASQ
jgi:hypothetical protein